VLLCWAVQVFRGRDVALLYSQLKIFFPDVTGGQEPNCRAWFLTCNPLLLTLHQHLRGARLLTHTPPPLVLHLDPTLAPHAGALSSPRLSL